MPEQIKQPVLKKKKKRTNKNTSFDSSHHINNQVFGLRQAYKAMVTFLAPLDTVSMPYRHPLGEISRPGLRSGIQRLPDDSG